MLYATIPAHVRICAVRMFSNIQQAQEHLKAAI